MLTFKSHPTQYSQEDDLKSHTLIEYIHPHPQVLYEVHFDIQRAVILFIVKNKNLLSSCQPPIDGNAVVSSSGGGSIAT